ncbi:MAG: VWA domain-containing protein [Acidobacteriaceae bacterium]|nr:VWA domain-containing protein [Acidobacteriaceae bacterium]
MKFRRICAGLSTFAFIFLSSGLVYVCAAQEGPQSQSSDSVAKPRKKPQGEDNNTTPEPEAAPAPEENAPIPSEYKRPKDVPQQAPTFRSNATTVNVDVAVLDDKNHFIPRIPAGNFRVLEDGVPQQISQFGQGEAPMTICMVIEFSGRFQAFWTQGWYETLQASYGFLETLKPDDNVAVVAFDLRTTILSDFSPDKRKAEEAMSRLRIPGFSESNVFDALTDMADRMQNIEGRKAILYLGSGLDTFSKITFDQARRKLQEAAVPIYTISTLQVARIQAEAYGMSPSANMTFLQADNEMRTFAKETGGMAFFPRFYGEYPTVFRQIEDSLKSQYSLAYHPTNLAHDGKFRHIKVELVNPSTNEPLRITNEKGKPIKYQVVAKAGYKAPREVD